jgi:hypothetical protein
MPPSTINSSCYMNNPLPVLLTPVPERQYEVTALDILGIADRELSISKAYVFFLSQNQNLDIAKGLLESLLDLICKELEKSNHESKTELIAKLKGFNLKSVDTERLARNRKRIDILLRDDQQNLCIAIENKINAALYNRLEDYLYPMETKDYTTVLVVLSLHPSALKDISSSLNGAPIVGILHSQWMKNTPPPQNNEPLSAHFSDFQTHLKQISQLMTFDETTEYYFQHSKTINAALKTKENALAFLRRQLELAAARNNLTLEWKNGGYSYLKRNQSNYLFITIIQGALLDEQVLIIILEKQRGIAPDKLEQLRAEIQKVEGQKIKYDGFHWHTQDKTSNEHHEHLMILKSEPLSLKQIEDIHSLISEFIGAYFLPLIESTYP